MSRIGAKVECDINDIIDLERIIQNPFSDPRLVQRARAILMLADGKQAKEVAKVLSADEHAVGKWRKQYSEEGIKGIYDRENPRRRGKGNHIEEQVMELLQNNRSGEANQWTTKTLSEAVGTSVDTIRRILKKNHLQLSRNTIWKIAVTPSDFSVYGWMSGMYLSQDVSAMIVSHSTKGPLASPNADITGMLITGNRNEYIGITENSKKVSLSDAIHTSAQNVTFEGKVADGFQKFLEEVTRNDMDTKSMIYYQVFLLQSESAELHMHLQADMTVQKETDPNVWMKIIHPWLNGFCVNQKSGETAQTIMQAIEEYLSVCTDTSEAFQWMLLPKQVATN